MNEKMLCADPEIILREIADEYLLIPTGAAAMRIHGMISLTESGAMLWERLSAPECESRFTAYILEEYDVSEQEAKRDVREFLQKMINLGLVREAA